MEEEGRSQPEDPRLSLQLTSLALRSRGFFPLPAAMVWSQDTAGYILTRVQ
jgi:hypothetical protein